MSFKHASVYLLASLVGCATAGFVGAQGFAAGAGQVAVIVNGEKIPAAEVDKLLKRDTPPPHPLTAKQKQDMWEAAVDMLVNDKLMQQFLAKSTPPVTADQIAKEVDLLKTTLAQQKPSMTIEKYLKESEQTEADLKEEMTVRIQWRSYVTQRLPDALVKKYYDANKVFFDKVFVRASHILLKVPDKATPQQKQAVKTQIMQIRQQILAGQVKFEDAAKKYSDCPSGKAIDPGTKKDKGGDLGFFPYKFAVAEQFAQTAFALKVGDISDPIETEFGFHIIKVTDRTKGEDSDFSKIIDMVRDVYAQDVQLFQSVINEQRKTAKIQAFPPKF